VISDKSDNEHIWRRREISAFFVTTTMRTIRIILIVLVLIGFPALSWYYLNSGLKWRITAQDATAKKERLADFALLKSDSTLVSDADLWGTFYL
jgi:hypothetical protein